MAEHTRLSTPTPEEETYQTCDVCGEEINSGEYEATRCEMCGRDVHDDDSHDCCGDDPNGEEGFPTCKICLSFASMYHEVLGECLSKIEAERELWYSQCQSHKYDNRERPRSVGNQTGFSDG